MRTLLLVQSFPTNMLHVCMVSTVILLVGARRNKIGRYRPSQAVSTEYALELQYLSV